MAQQFPESIKMTGTRVEEFYFLSERIEGKKKKYTLMRAGQNSVEEVADESVARDLELPVYMRLLDTLIKTGMMKMEMA